MGCQSMTGKGDLMPISAAGENQLHALYQELTQAMRAGQALHDAAISDGCGCFLAKNELCPPCRARLLAAVDAWEKL